MNERELVGLGMIGLGALLLAFGKNNAVKGVGIIMLVGGNYFFHIV